MDLASSNAFKPRTCEEELPNFVKNEKYLQKCKDDLATKMGDTFINSTISHKSNFDVEQHAVQIH
jgi:hypothetical protein